jgi:hypothetical protein
MGLDEIAASGQKHHEPFKERAMSHNGYEEQLLSDSPSLRASIPAIVRKRLGTAKRRARTALPGMTNNLVSILRA